MSARCSRHSSPPTAVGATLLEGSVLPDSYAIIVETLFPPTDHYIVESLATGIERRQLPNGGFGLYPGHPGDFSTTLEAYLALRLAGRPANAQVIRPRQGLPFRNA